MKLQPVIHHPEKFVSKSFTETLETTNSGLVWMPLMSHYAHNFSNYESRLNIGYMPSGEQPAISADKFSEQRDIWATPYKFNGKELDAETGLYYYGARYYTPEIGIWLSVDPLSDKYPSMSAYMYCAGNPVILVDPDGREIDPASIVGWNFQKYNINSKREELKGQALVNGLTGGKVFQKEADRFNSLGNTLETMNNMEKSSQKYSLDPNNSNVGGTTMNKDGSITLSFSNTALFVHEATHGGQYESGDIGFLNSFDPNQSGKGVAMDYWDEFEAYAAQSAYDPNSLPNRSTPSGTKDWLLGIKEFDYSNYGQTPINANSKENQVRKALPNSDPRFMKGLPMKALGSFNFKKN
jgi:RHS repeat-associated protein